MADLIVTEFVTLDGVMEAPGGEPSHPNTNWVTLFFDEEIGECKSQETMAAERLLLGRVTYESFAGAWPGYEGEMAVKMNTMPKHVATRTLTTLEWENSHVLGDDLVGAVNELTATSTGPVLVAGSCQLVHALLRADLVDELRLMVFPVAIGGGLRVFPDDRGALLRYALTDVRTFTASGVVQTTYRRA